MANQVRKKLIGWTIAIATPLVGGVIYYFILLFLYLPSEDLYNFPVPRNAELIKENEVTKSYDWSTASEENGIPFGYELVIKINGWKKGEREGALVLYTKGDKKIDLICTRMHLDILKAN